MDLSALAPDPPDRCRVLSAGAGCRLRRGHDGENGDGASEMDQPPDPLRSAPRAPHPPPPRSKEARTYSLGRSPAKVGVNADGTPPVRRNGSSPPTARSTTSSTSAAIASPPPSTEPPARKPSRSGPRSPAPRLPHRIVAPMSYGASHPLPPQLDGAIEGQGEGRWHVTPRRPALCRRTWAPRPVDGWPSTREPENQVRRLRGKRPVAPESILHCHTAEARRSRSARARARNHGRNSMRNRSMEMLGPGTNRGPTHRRRRGPRPVGRAAAGNEGTCWTPRPFRR